MDIVEELRKDRESGARRLEAEYKAGLLTLARRFCHDPGDAEELVNRTFAAVINGIDDFLEQSSFFTWMCQILSNIHAMDNRRLANRDIVYPGVLPEVADEDAREAIYRDVDAALLRDAVDRLPDDMRELLLLHYFMDMPVAKMAKILAIPCGTVRSKLFYARKALAARLGVKAHEAVKKPVVKATLIALALCATAALGAVWWGELSERAAAGGQRSATAAIGETGETGETSGLSPVPPDSPVPPVADVPSSISSNSSTQQPINSSTSGDAMNNTTLRSLAASAAFAAAGAASTASGGLLYEPSNYAAQENLVLHLDGIRNAGALKAHDASATSWADLASSRTAAIREISSIPSRSVPATSLANGTSGWTNDGFYFNGTSFAQMSSALELGNTYTIQVVCDVDTGTFQNRFTQSSGLASEGNLQWPGFVGTTDTDGKDYCNIYYNCGSGQQKVNGKANNVNYGVYVAQSGWTGHYLTAWANGSKASLFASDSVGTQANFNQSIGTRTLTFGASYGSTTYGAWRRSLVGTIKAIRIYDKALSEDELAANCVIDEARFFTGIPVTNVIVATAVEGLEGNEASGAYALDDGGHTFSVPATATTSAGTYSCTGYTLETWDGSAWGAPVPYESCSYSATETSALVRLTWQWEQTSAFVDYTLMASPADANWNTTSLNWNSGVAWVNGNNAIFPATSSQKTIAASGTPVANNVAFNGSGYRIDGSLKVDGRLTANADCTIANCLAGDGVVLGGNSTVHMGSSGSPSLKTLTLEDSVTVNANNRQCFGPDPTGFSTNIVVGGTAPTLRINSGSVDLGANRFVRIASQGLNLGANAPLTFTLRSFAADGPASGDFSGNTFVKIQKDYNGTVALAPAAGATNAIGRVQNYGDLAVRGGTVSIGSATDNGTGDNALMHVKGTNTVFSTRGRLTVDGGTLHSAQSTRYVDVNSYGQVIVTNRGRIHMPGVHWLNGHSTPGRLVVADGEFIIGTLRVSQSGGNESTVYLGEGGFMAASTLRMDNNSKGTFTFDGGAFQATGSGTLFDGADDKWANVVFAVGAKGAVFDCTNGKGMTWAQPLVSGVAAGDVDGGVTVLGADPEVGVEFSGAATNNSYTGTTVVSNAMVKYTQNCSLSGSVKIRGDATGCGRLSVAAGQDISGLTLTVDDIDSFDAEAGGNFYKVLDAPDGYVGKFALAPGFPKSKWDVRYDTDAAYLSPIKAFVIMLK